MERWICVIRDQWREWLSWAGLILMLLYMVLCLFFRQVTVIGDSMSPTLEEGQSCTIKKYLYEAPARGDIMVIKYRSEEHDDIDLGEGNHYLIKRVIAVPGDTVEIKKSIVYINGEAIEEPYVSEWEIDEEMSMLRLGADEYFLMGDNRDNSLDSRLLGPVNKEEFWGKLLRY